MLAQILAVVIFVFMFAAIVQGKFERHWITLGCGLATILFVFGIGMRSTDAIMETLNLRTIFTSEFWHVTGEATESTSGINWATIIFIAGMMVMVEGMAEAGFFRWLCLRIAKAVNYQTIPIFITFMIMSAVLSMFIDSITVILFLAAVTVELAQLLKFTPVPFILAEIFCANLGGSATMSGDPPNIIIGTALGYSFFDFLGHTGVIAGISLVFTVLFFYFAYRKEIIDSDQEDGDIEYPDPKDAILDKKEFIFSSIIFACAVVMLVTHAQTGLTVASIGVIVATPTIIVAGKKTPDIMKRVDYKTLLFFIGLFVVVGGLEQTGILNMIADVIAKISDGNIYVMVAIILWVSACASAFVDNIPFAATMVPVIQALAASQGVHIDTLAWTLSMGTDIGASANVVGTAVAAKHGYPISWKKYCKAAVPATIMVVLISMVTIYLRYL